MVDLVLRERRTAADPETASAALSSVLGEGRVTTGGDRFAYVQESLVDDGISITRIASSGTDVRAETTGSPDLAVVLVRRGTVTLRRGSDEAVLGEGDLGLLPMTDFTELGWDSTTVDLFSFPASSLARLLGTERRALRLHAPTLVPQNASLAAYWRQLAANLTFRVLDDPALYQRDLLRGGLVDALIAATIETFALSDSVEDEATRDEEAVRHAIAFMRERLGDPLSVARIALAAGLSVRGLQLLFQRELESTPVAYLRRLRLERARVVLNGPDADVSVGTVAASVGYTNVGRFSAHYRDQYGEMPSRTLQQTRAAAPRPGSPPPADEAPAG
ncbi:MAG TPA: helix-turn-helix domain-containing protein [Amnibacterium sp.]|nr:helix-turn-helix domain-containing protein [Amnibacterium sp.]